MLHLFVRDAVSDEKILVIVEKATEHDRESTKDWQTNWTTTFARQLPNQVALRRADDQELLGLMAYELDESCLAVEVIYLESARHSNANLLHIEGSPKRYYGIAKALFAYAVEVSLDAGFDGVLMFKAKTSELLDYYKREFGACQVAAYDPYRMVIWEDAAERIVSEFRRDIHV